MRRQPGEQRARARQIVAELRTAVRMRKGDDTVDLPGGDQRGVTLFGRARDLFGGERHTAHRRQYPDLVARAYTAIGAAIALPDRVFGDGRGRRHDRCPAQGVLLLPHQRGHQIVAVDMRAGRDRGRGTADRQAVFHHAVPDPVRRQRELVPLGNIVGKNMTRTVQRDLLARPQRTQGHRHRVSGMHLHRIGHVVPPLPHDSRAVARAQA